MYERFVVARHAFGGIGDHLSCLVGSWYFAKRTGRTLVVDWRGSRFNDDPDLQRNCFETWFQPLDVVDGVPTITSGAVSTIPWRGTIWPSKWTIDDLKTAAHLRHSDKELRETAALIASDDDVPDDVVVFNSWLDPWPPKSEMEKFLGQLKFSDAVNAKVDEFRHQTLRGKGSIAIHIRHGNGENIGNRAAYWLGPVTLIRQLLRNRAVSMHAGKVWGRFSDNMPDSLVGMYAYRHREEALLKHIAQKVKQLRQLETLKEAIPILFTDAPHLIEMIRTFLDDVITLDADSGTPLSGPLHHVFPVEIPGRYDALSSTVVNQSIVQQMMYELAVMRDAKALVCMDSGFTAIARAELGIDRTISIYPPLINRLIIKINQRF